MTSTDTPRVPRAAAPLPSGAVMPLLGFGTWQITGESATRATGWALESGYRHLDTAAVYRNEGEVGAAIRGSRLDRGELFVTTKVPPEQAGREIDTLHRSLALLGTPYVDLWLIHWPPRDSAGPAMTAMWRALIEARDQGLTRDIGVSNFPLALVDEIREATGETPAVNQVKWSPLLFDRAVLDGHRERGVVLEGYSALRGGTLEHPVITAIAERLGRTPAQVIVRWHLEHGVVVIPKSEHRDRVAGNADVDGFELTADDVAALDALGSG